MVVVAFGLGVVVVLLVMARHRATGQRERDESAEQNALDRGLALLIKDLSRNRDSTPLVPMVPTRGARGTPSDAVVIASRLAAIQPIPPSTPSPFAEDEPTTVVSAYIVNRRS
jgi:hypothetical protein